MSTNAYCSFRNLDNFMKSKSKMDEGKVEADTIPSEEISEEIKNVQEEGTKSEDTTVANISNSVEKHLPSLSTNAGKESGDQDNKSGLEKNSDSCIGPKPDHEASIQCKSENNEITSCSGNVSPNEQVKSTVEMKETKFESEESDIPTNFKITADCEDSKTDTLSHTKQSQPINHEIKEAHQGQEEKELECIPDRKSGHVQSVPEDTYTAAAPSVVNNSCSKDEQLPSTDKIKQTDCDADNTDTNPDFECISDTKSEHEETNLEESEILSGVGKASPEDCYLLNKGEKNKTHNDPKKSNADLGLDLECISDTKSEHDPYEDIDEYYDSISEDDHTAADVVDISSSEDEHFVDTVPKHTFADLPFVPKPEFSSELLNTVKEEKFDSEENNFNRKPFSSAVQSSTHPSNSPQLVQRADFSVPPPNFNYANNQNVNFQGYNYDQTSYYNTAQQQAWYGNQSGYDAASYANQQFYPGSTEYQNFDQAAYQNYYQGAYTNQHYNYQPNLGVQAIANQPETVPVHPVPNQTPDTQTSQFNPQTSQFNPQTSQLNQQTSQFNPQTSQFNPLPQANSNVVGNVVTPSSVSVSGKGDKSAVKNVSGASMLKKNTVAYSVVTSEEQGQTQGTADSVAVAPETNYRPVSYKPSSCVVSPSPAADWLDENGDPIKGAFDFDAPEDSVNSAEDKSSKVEYVFSVRSSKSAIDSPNNTVPTSNTQETAQISNLNKQSETPSAGLSVSELLAAERAKVSEKDVPVQQDEEKKLYEASKTGDEYKAALQEALATTSLAKVTPSTSKQLSENPLVQKERVNRFKRMQFTNQKDQPEPDQPNMTATAPGPFTKSEQDVALESQAINEILKEVQHGAARAKQYGALGWQKNPVPAVNKTFLHNTLVSTLRKPYKPPSKRGGRATQGLHDKDGNQSSSSSRSSRSYSSDSRSSSGSSRSSYTSDSDSDGSRSCGPPGSYEEAWAAYAAQFGYPWMGPDAYGMYYGPDGWPMDPYHPMFYGDPQAWAECEAYYGSQGFNPRGRGRGFRGRGRGMDFRGRGEFRGKGWGPPDFRGGGRGMEFRGGPPRGFPFTPRSRGMGPRYPPGRNFSRSRSRSSSGDSGRRGLRYNKGSSKTSRAGSRNSRSKSRSPPSAVGGKRDRDRSQDRAKDGGAEKESENDSNDKSKKKKKKKHRKSKKRKDKDKTETADGDPNLGEGEKPNEGGEGEKGQDNEEDKKKSKKAKKRSKHRRKDGKRKKDTSKEGKQSETARENVGDEDLSKEKIDEDKIEETRRKEKNSEDKEGNHGDNDERSQKKKKRRDHEKGEKSKRSKDDDSEDKRREKSSKGDKSERPWDRERRTCSPHNKESSDVRQRQDTPGEAIENDLRLKLKARREQRLLEEDGKSSEHRKEKTADTNSKLKSYVKSSERWKEEEKAHDEPSSGDRKKVKKKVVKKKKKEEDNPGTSTACGEDGETEPKRRKVVKKIVRRKVIRDSSGAIVDSATIVGEKREVDSREGKDRTVVSKEEYVEGADGKRKRIIKRTIIVKRKKRKENPGCEEVQTPDSRSERQGHTTQLSSENPGVYEDVNMAQQKDN